jgi:hypothetical protein
MKPDGRAEQLLATTLAIRSSRVAARSPAIAPRLFPKIPIGPW